MRSRVSRLDSEFDLVLIAELIPESLVLLKEMLCWRTEDVAYADKNVNRKKRKRRGTGKEKEQFNTRNLPKLCAGSARGQSPS